MSKNPKGLHVLVRLDVGSDILVAKRIYVPFHPDCTFPSSMLASLGSPADKTAVTTSYLASINFGGPGTTHFLACSHGELQVPELCGCGSLRSSALSFSDRSDFSERLQLLVDVHLLKQHFERGQPLLQRGVLRLYDSAVHHIVVRSP